MESWRGRGGVSKCESASWTRRGFGLLCTPGAAGRYRYGLLWSCWEHVRAQFRSRLGHRQRSNALGARPGRCVCKACTEREVEIANRGAEVEYLRDSRLSTAAQRILLPMTAAAASPSAGTIQESRVSGKESKRAGPRALTGVIQTPWGPHPQLQALRRGFQFGPLFDLFARFVSTAAHCAASRPGRCYQDSRTTKLRITIVWFTVRVFLVGCSLESMSPIVKSPQRRLSPRPSTPRQPRFPEEPQTA
ncbi:hypothetical protein BCR34DRAFT_584430 [Clohesyomyces aquaticus]|uniref:Uncharacterized protein n=1 Tax=Clohesyomyces aquaticus TaxID=1231657 RepID=A0A1Y2A1V4_9PLEO|nr:hypothetical protein BCR34DRAFT_584430 [Clohesyomyces aquaticus]